MNRHVKTNIFDIDGTLADVEHRRHHLAQRPQRWDRFFAEALYANAPEKTVTSMNFDPPTPSAIRWQAGVPDRRRWRRARPAPAPAPIGRVP